MQPDQGVRVGWTSFDAPLVVPMAIYDTPLHRVEVLLDCLQYRSRLIVDGQWEVALPLPGVVQRVLDWGSNSIVVIGRGHPDPDLWLAWAARGQAMASPIPVPVAATTCLFRGAASLESEILLVLYDVRESADFLFRLAEQSAGPVFDDSFRASLDLGSIDSSVLLATAGANAILACGQTWYTYHPGVEPSLQRQAIDPALTIVELLTSSQAALALCQARPSTAASASAAQKPRFCVLDLFSGGAVSLDAGGGIPYCLHWDESGAWGVNRAVTYEDRLMMLQHDVESIRGTGILDLGVDNREGRIAWSQVYYLNGFIDLIDRALRLR